MERVQADPAAPPPRRVRRLRLLVIVATLAFPGFGQGLAGRLRRMVVWVAANLASPIFAVIAPWLTLFVLGVIRVVAAADAVWCLRKVDRSPPRHRALAAAAMVAMSGRLMHATGSSPTRNGRQFSASGIANT
jgi:hypothetical protein